MPAPQTRHPTADSLAAFAAGHLAGADARAVAAHLESCPECRRAAEGARAGSSGTQVRGATPAPPPRSGTQLPTGKAPAPATPPPGLPPELANHPRYRILRELGRGGMGVVYQARQTIMNRAVVIKVINKALLDQPGALERFHREVQAAAKLSHPNIVTAYDAEQAGDLHMLAMEFVPGQNLAEVLQKKGPLPVAQACHFTRQVALGLQHAHDRGMVHRDIKPQNLMLTPQGQVKVLDFGLAKVASERAGGQGLTASNSYMGTPDYSAPEQATDAHSADIRADLYSLGCTLYCLLAGRPPFQEDTAVKTILAHLEKEPVPLPELRADVPAGLWQVVARLLAKDPARRYSKPAELAQALAPFCKPATKTAPGAAAPGQATAPPRDTTRKAPARAEAPVARLLDDRVQQPPSKPQRLVTKPVRRRTLSRPVVAGAVVAVVAVLAAGGLGTWLLVTVLVKPDAQTAEGKARQSAPAQVRPDPVKPAAPVARVTERPKDPTPAPAAANESPVASPSDSPAKAPAEPKRADTAPEAGPSRGASQEPAVAAPKAGTTPSPAPPPGDTRSYWAHAAGTFERIKGNLWYESATGFFFRETARTKDLVELYRTEPQNGNREVRIHLHGDAAFIQGANGPWVRLPFNAGRWTQPPPAPAAEGPATTAKPARAGDWVPLFNGADLTGWKAFRGDHVHWTFEGGALVGRSTPTPDYCLLVTERSDYRNFHFRMETMLPVGGNCGAFFRVGPPREGRGSYMGYMVRAQGSRDNQEILKGLTGSLFLGADLSWPPLPLALATDVSLKPGLWFTQEVIAEGNHLRVLIDGQKVVDYTDPADTFTAGRLALSCPGDSIVKFRKVEIKELPDQPSAAETATAPTTPGEPDPIGDTLDKAKADFKAGMDKARAQLLAALDKAEEAARQAGNKGAVDQIQAERAAFAEGGKVPKAVPARDYLLEKSRGRAALDAAYKDAVAAYTKAKMDDRAEAAEKERRRFELDMPLDAFQPGTVWRGVTDIYVLGTPERASIPSSLTVLERDDTSFKARFQDGNASREVRGALSRGILQWLARDAKPIQGGPGTDHIGKLGDTALELRTEWRRETDRRTLRAITKLQLEKK